MRTLPHHTDGVRHLMVRNPFRTIRPEERRCAFHSATDLSGTRSGSALLANTAMDPPRPHKGSTPWNFKDPPPWSGKGRHRKDHPWKVEERHLGGCSAVLLEARRPHTTAGKVARRTWSSERRRRGEGIAGHRRAEKISGRQGKEEVDVEPPVRRGLATGRYHDVHARAPRPSRARHRARIGWRVEHHRVPALRARGLLLPDLGRRAVVRQGRGGR